MGKFIRVENLSPRFIQLFLFIVTFLCYFNSLNCGFAFDDASAIVSNKDLLSKTPLLNLFKNDFWGTPLTKENSHKSYRPLTVLTFRMNYFVHELRPFGYHLVNVLLHCFVVCLFNEMLNSFHFVVKFDVSAKIFASILFAVHPVHTEAVTGLVGRAELLSALFYLFSLLIFVKRRRTFVSLVFICVGTFCKEQSITGVGVCILWHFFEKFDHFSSTKTYLFQIFCYCWRTVVQFGVGTVVILTLRFAALLGSLPYFTAFDNPAAAADFPERHLTYNFLLVLNFWLLLCPSTLCADWTMGTVSLVTVFDIRLCGIIVFWLTFTAVVVFAMKSRGMESFCLKMSLILLVLPFVPASNLFFPVGFVIAERVLYLPSMGYCMLVALGWKKAVETFPNTKTLMQISMIFCCVVFSAKTFTRNFDWQNEYTLFLSGLKVTQQNAKIFNNVGHALEAKGQLTEALSYFIKATVVQPDDVGSWMNAGRTLIGLKQYNNSEKYFLTAKKLLTSDVLYQNSSTARIAPQHLNVFINLGEVYKHQNRLTDAEMIYRQAIRMRSDFISAYMNLGDLLLRLNRTDEAVKVFTTGLQYDPFNADLLYDTGVVHFKRGELKEALEFFEQALSADPNHAMSLINSAFIIEDLSKTSSSSSAFKQKLSAVDRLKKASVLKPNDTHLFLHLGNLQYDCQLYTEALESFKLATNLDSQSKTGLQNLASVQIHLGMVDDGLETLKKLLDSFPNNIRALLTLCDVYSNHLKNMTAAENCYRQILNNVDKNHVQARHNLCIVLINSRKQTKAEQCLLEAKSLVSFQGPYTLDLFKVLSQKFKSAFKI